MITPEDDEDVWHLNLDMVESQSGKVLQKIYQFLMLERQHIGLTTIMFYSRLRPYLKNKVVLPDEKGLATTRLVPMLPDSQRFR